VSGVDEPDGGVSVPNESNELELKAVIDAYYTRGIAVVDRAREAAQRGYTIASAIAAALVTAGVFANLSDRPRLVQVLGLAALGSWLIVAVLFIAAVALPAAQGRDPDTTTGESFVEMVARRTQEELEVVKSRLARAFAATCAAIAITGTALAVATFDVVDQPVESARIAVTKQGDAALASLCDLPVGDIDARVDPDALDDDIVKLEIPAGKCNAAQTTVRLPKAVIVAERRFTGFPR
jgi:hypothetical protein